MQSNSIRPGRQAQTIFERPRALPSSWINSISSLTDTDNPRRLDDFEEESFRARFESLRGKGKGKSGEKRYQYTREFKLAAISFVREYAMPRQDGSGIMCMFLFSSLLILKAKVLIFIGIVPARISQYAAAQIIGVTRKMLLDWRRNENNILQLRVGQKKSIEGRSAQLPALEKELHTQFLELRKMGKKIRRTWFIVQGRKIYESLYPDQVYVDPITRVKR